jgi:hypothetical protein
MGHALSADNNATEAEDENQADRQTSRGTHDKKGKEITP